ncbi:MAG: STAS domain-containing protein [Bacteroidetes bacterium]|nr:STAS domain-containing protein [Bacteroidota bacterium]
MAFESKITEQGSSVIFQLSGKLINEADSIQLNDRVDMELDSGIQFIIFDLSQLQHCNSTGINVFIRSLTKSRIKGGDTFLVNLHSDLNTLFKITRVQDIFNIYTSIEEVEKTIQSNNK